jgi:alkylation response protein AidB-like acyl-CoA dehydrogenase
MDFRLDDQQLALQETVATFCASRYPLDGLGRRETADAASTARAWSGLAELGVFSILRPESGGGLGLGVAHAALVFEQLGYHLVDGPLVWSALAASTLIDVADRAWGGLDQLPDDGEPIVVPHAGQVDGLVILDAGEVRLIEADQLPTPHLLDPLDPLTPVGRYPHLPDGRVVAGAGEVDRLRLVGTVLTAALQVGVAQAALDVARDYALEREQFDRPIASFQALKHLMADMYVRTGLARSSTYAAAAVLDDPAVGHIGRSVSGAKLLAGEAAIDNARAAVQILGGMGFTWEMPTNYLLKRAWVLEQTFGDSARHALAISDSLAGAAA